MFQSQSRQKAKFFLQSSVLGLLLWFWWEGHTYWRGREWESLNSDEGTYTVVLFINIYFLFSNQTGQGDETECLEREG
jgi:hypothetical protein